MKILSMEQIYINFELEHHLRNNAIRRKANF